jgi:hypothetical protein
MIKFILYALVVTVVTSCSSWARLSDNDSPRGSTWSSHTGGGGGSFGGGSGGGGHK